MSILSCMTISVNKDGIGMKSDYDRPFPVPIPAGSSLMRDDTIKSLVSGKSLYTVNKDGIGMKSDYNRPFPVPTPAGSSLMRDDTTKSLISLW